MPVLRHKQTKNYASIPNAVLQDQRLSCRDLGLLVWMLSKPSDWAFSHKAICSELKLDSKGSIQNSVKKLEECGYLRIEQEQKGGRFGKTVWNVSDAPYPECQDTVDGSPYPGISESDKSASYKRKTKQKAAAPAFEGGGRAPPGMYFDHGTGEWRRKA